MTQLLPVERGLVVPESTREWSQVPFLGNQPFQFTLPTHVETATFLPTSNIVVKVLGSPLVLPEKLLRQILSEIRGHALLFDPAEAAADTASEQLTEIVTLLQRGGTLPPPAPEIDCLLERAIERKRNPPADIEEWARQLAASVGHLTD